MLSRRVIRVLFAALLFVHAYGIRIASFAATGSVLTIKQTQIEFFLGVDDGIYPNQELYILRNKKLLGKISVTFVGEMTSWGEMTSLETGVVPEPGDQISSWAPSVKGSSKTTSKTTTPSVSATVTIPPEKNTLSKTTPQPVVSTTTTTTTNTPTSLQKELLKKKEIGKKGNIYLVLEAQAGITLGKKDGLKEGDEVVVFQGNETAGKVKVKTLLEDYSLCDMQPSSGKTFKKGDVVIFNPFLIVDEKKEDKKEDKKEEKKEQPKEEVKETKKEETKPPPTP